MPDASTTKLVCFFLNDQEYAARIGDVKETLTMRPISRVFLTPEWVAGIINLRGDIVAVIDLALMLGMRASERKSGRRSVQSEGLSLSRVAAGARPRQNPSSWGPCRAPRSSACL